MQRTFVSDVSHELRTPLTTVRMAGDVLHDARASFDPVTARAAELLQTELDRFENLLGDLLEISRFDAGAAVLDLEDTNLGDVVHRVVGSRRADGAAARGAGDGPRRRRVHGRGRRTPGRADRAQPGHQRDRPRRGQRRHRPAGRRRRGHGADRARPRRRAAAGAVGDGVQPVLARRPRAGPHHRRHRPRPGDRARGRAAARRLAAGLGHPGWRRAVPADPAAPRRRPAHAQPAAAGAHATSRRVSESRRRDARPVRPRLADRRCSPSRRSRAARRCPSPAPCHRAGRRPGRTGRRTRRTSTRPARRRTAARRRSSRASWSPCRPTR